jgi:hypothetical protein
MIGGSSGGLYSLVEYVIQISAYTLANGNISLGCCQSIVAN